MPYLKYIFLLCILVSPFMPDTFCRNNEPGELSGIVTDGSTNTSISDANIYIHEIKRWARADADGHYRFTSLPRGNFTVEVSHVGYQSFIGVVQIGGNTVRNFELKKTVIESENVTVTGVSSVTQLRDVPAHISVITKKELERSSGINILDAVARQPGVNVVTSGPAIAKPFIRGLGYNRVVTINDGMRQEGQQWGDEHGLEVDEYSAQKIEVLRGPASLMYGSDAIGGVIQVLTNIPIPVNLIRANFSATANSNNKMWGQHADVAGNVDGFNWNMYGSRKTAGDYQNKFDGAVLNSRFNEKNFGGYIGLNKNWGYSHLIFSNFNQRLGMVEGKRAADGSFVLEGYTDDAEKGRNVLVPNQKVNHTKFALDNSFSFKNDGRFTALLGYQRNKRQEFGEPDHPNEAEAYFDLKTINYTAAYHLPYSEKWRMSFGVNGMHQQNTNRGEEAIIPDYGLFDAGVYSYGSLFFKNTTVSGGLRYDFRNIGGEKMTDGGATKFEAFEKNFSNLSASMGLTHQVSGAVLLKGNVSRGFRAPSASELAANGEHEGTSRYEIGNRDMESENSLSLDAGLQITTGHIDVTIAPFYNNISNYIFYQKVLTVSGSDSLIGGAPVFKFNQQNAHLRGIEASFDLHPHPLDWLHFENTLSIVRGKFKNAVDGSYNLPLIAPARLRTELRAEFLNELKTFKNFYIKFEMDNVASQNHFFAGYNTETATDGYTLFNAGLGTDVELNGKRRASIILGITNITDKAYQSHLSRLKYLDGNPATGRAGVFNMGRNFTARLIVPMEWKVK